MFYQFLLQFVLIMLNAIFASAEIAVISMSDSKINKLATEGNRRAKRLAKLTEKPERFLAAIQVAITLSGFLASAFAADNFADDIVGALLDAGIPIPKPVLNKISVVFITLILSFFTLVFGELVPKRYAMSKTEKVALGLSGFVGFVSKLFAPLVWLLSISTNGILRLMGIDPHADGEDLSEENIRMMADAGSEKGLIDEDENEIIQNVFEFDDLSVEEIATHRTETVFIWEEDTAEDWRKTITGTNHACYPICRDTADNIIGVLDTRIYFRLENQKKEEILKKAVKPAYFAPASMKADTLFNALKNEKTHFAVVIDEYGGTYGIITMNDLLECIVGELDTIEKPEYTQTADGEYRISGLMELDKFEKLFDISLDSDYSTVGGWVVDYIGYIPEAGHMFEFENLSVTVTKTDNKRIHEITCKILKTD